MKVFKWPDIQRHHFSINNAQSMLILFALSMLVSACDNIDNSRSFEMKTAEIISPPEAPFINIDSLTTSKQHLYVSDIHHIKVFDLQGNYIKSIGEQGSDEGQFAGDVIGVTLNSRRELLAVDMLNHRVQVFDNQGNFIRAFGNKGSGDGEFLQPQGILTDQFDLIYISDKARSDIQVFSPEGEFLYRIGHKGKGLTELSEPESMAIHNEKLYVADEDNHRIQVFTPRGVYLESLPGFGVLVSAQMESSMDDIPYQTEFDKLYERTAEGDIEGIAFDNKDRLYFVDEDQNAIKIIEKGHVIATITSQADMKSADGIAFSSDFSQLYIADQGSNRVLVFDVSKINRHIEKD